MSITRAVLVAMVFAACGGGGNDRPDASAGGPDAHPADASAPDAVAVGSIQVRTETRCCDLPPGSPAAGVTIYVIAPDRTLASTSVTDDLGNVTIDDVVTGSAVMAVYPPTAVYPVTVTTFLAVEPGDTLVFGERYPLPVAFANVGDITVDFPPVSAATVELRAWLPCGATSDVTTSSPAHPHLYADCQRPVATVPVIATDDAGRIVESAVLRDINLYIGGAYTIDAWTPALARTITASVPTFVVQANLALHWRYPFSSLRASEPATITGGVASASIAAPVGADGVAAAAYLDRDGLGEQGFARMFPADASAVDVPITDLPWIYTPTLSLPDQRVSWIQEGTGGDGVIAQVVYVPAGGSDYVWWNVIGPAGDGEVSWANFPAQVPAPRPGDATLSPSLHLADLDTASSYRELRAAAEWQIYCPLCAVSRGELQSAGAVAANGNGLDD